MAYLYIPDNLSSIESGLKNMYLYFFERGLDLSKPIEANDLNKIRNQYISETDIDPLFFTEKDLKSTGVVVTSESLSFSNINDVSVNMHYRYCPVPIHSHEHFEIMCVIKGNCRVYIGDNCVRMQTGDTLIIPPYVAHTISVFNDDCILYNEEIRFSTLRSKFANLLSTKQIISDLFLRSFDYYSNPCYLMFYTGDYFLNDNKFGDIVAEFNNGCKFSFDILNILTSAFLYDLLRKFSSTATITTINEKSKIEILLTKYITEHCETVTLAELGRKFSYSDRQISRIIKKNTGLSYSELVQKIKMESTAKMLAETRIPIKKIIEMSGFSSKSYFFKIFRSYYGKTPLEYRNSGSPSEIDINSRQRSG